MPKILIVEDDQETAQFLLKHLLSGNYQVEIVADGEDAHFLLRANEYDLVIVDWHLPTITGIELCRQYRADGGRMPILMLTGRGATADKVRGFESGVDDYLVKPFEMEELLARVQALLRRSASVGYGPVLQYRDLELDPQSFAVKKGDKEIRLLPKEFAVLELLLRHRGRVLSAQAIINRVWHADETPGPEVIRNYIMNIRKKLGDDSFIQTVHGVGYKI